MYTWIDFALSFTAGTVFGGILAFLRFKSKLKFYRYFTEQRLTDTNRRIMSPYASAHGHAR